MARRPIFAGGIITGKNKTVLIQFVMFPVLTVIIENAISIENMPEHFFANLFAVMYVGMAPLASASAIISEEKEKNTLRVLQLCNVKAAEYLLGNAVYIIPMCMAGSLVIGAAGGYAGAKLLKFMLLMLVGHSCSFLLGAAIGAAVKNQMTAASINIPVMLVLSFLPMLSMFNKTIRRFSKYIFSEQLYLLVNDLSEINITAETGIIMVSNAGVIVLLFLAVYRRSFILANAG